MRDDSGLQIVAYDDPGNASIELPHVYAAAHPAHLVHPESRLDISKTAVDKIRDEQIDRDVLAPAPVVIAHRRTRPVHFDPFSGFVDDVILPHARIVYDRYHMQAQFGKDVLGTVRLEEARKHRDNAMQLKGDGRAKAEIREEKRLYSEVKRARWILLAGEGSLSDDEASSLKKILDDHADLALCHAMKEEMARLFDIRDAEEARKDWTAWFDGAKASGIPALMRFAELKEKRIDGLIAHASHPISTGKLEGFNNRIKVAKRIAYGYRDEDYFFSLIQFISIPSVRAQSHRKT